MDKAHFEERLKVLYSERHQQEQIALQASNNVNAYNGAIQEANHWLNKILEPEKVIDPVIENT
jgi:hypothetical protein